MAYSYEYEMHPDADQELAAIKALRGEEYANACRDIARRMPNMPVGRWLYWVRHREAAGYTDSLDYLRYLLKWQTDAREALTQEGEQ